MTNSTETQPSKQSATLRRQLANRMPPRDGRPWQQALTWQRDAVTPQAFITLLYLAELNGDLTPPLVAVRLLAHRRGLSDRTIRYHLKELEQAKVLRIERSKISWCRNTPNRYILLDISGEPLHLIRARNCREKIKTELNTKTAKTVPVETAPQTTNRPAHSRSEENHPPQMRKVFELVATLTAQVRCLRAVQRGRNHAQRPPDASLGAGMREEGYYSGVTAQETAEEREFRERIAAKERIAREHFSGGFRR